MGGGSVCEAILFYCRRNLAIVGEYFRANLSLKLNELSSFTLSSFGFSAFASGGQLLHSFSNHQKTVTALAVDGTGSRLLSGGLDGHIKIHDLTTYRISHALKYQVRQTRQCDSAA